MIMSSEHRPREHRLVNPETASALLRTIVAAWDADDSEAFYRSLAAARELLNIAPPRDTADAS